jgi:hypothetical protein
MVAIVKNFKVFVLFLFIVFFIVACGGGGDSSKTLFDVNKPPQVTSKYFEIRESLTNVGQITSSDDENDSISYKLIGGDDKNRFEVTNSGVITLNFTTDYHNPSDTNLDNNYSITVEANDGLNKSTQSIIIAILENPLPKVDTKSFSIFETFREVGAIVVSDEENESVTIAIDGNGSDDSSRFVLNENNLSFNFTTEYDDNGSVSGDNNYTFRLKLDDGVNVVYEEINVSVTQVNHHGIIYDVIESNQGTNKWWLDRNLGASRACTSMTDNQCYGYYFQWGRVHDGHQESDSNRTSTTASTTSSTIEVAHGDFINNNVSPFDWTSDNNYTARINNWADTSGNSLCPKGFRVPTQVELNAELSSVSAPSVFSKMFSNFLKIPAAGYRRNAQDGSNNFEEVSLRGAIWFNTNGAYLSFSDSFINKNQTTIKLASGHSVRCIKD